MKKTQPLVKCAVALWCAGAIGTAAASQPKSLADVPDPNPEVEKAGFVVPEGFEINLYAAEPMLRKPVQMNWDSQGRLWVVSSTTYPHIKPGESANDQVVVLEDSNHDGVADKSTVFSDDLHIPTAILPGDGGAYVANSTEVVFLKDTNGDLKADEKTILLSGFGTEDTHHLLHAFRRGPEGLMYMLQSIYIHSHVETPYGIRRLMGGGVWEFRPETRRLEILSKGLINPWGFEFDRWGQSFATDGAGSEGINFIFPGSVFATSPGASRILHGMSPGQPKHCELEIVEDPHFPDDWQGTFVTSDFRGNRINRFKIERSGSGFAATQLEDVLASTNRAFRPIDVKVGPDGALYIADWYNPIIQHGEVDFRDERRDHVHGRIWRVTCKGRPLSAWPTVAGAAVPELLESLKSPRRWIRQMAKAELRGHGAATVTPALDAWAAAIPGKTESEIHQLLEAAWAREGVNEFSPELLRRLWDSGDVRAKAAALRILTHRWRVFPDTMKLLDAAVADADGLVRLWAVSVLADMRKPSAIVLALRVLDQTMDEPLDFALELMLREQSDVWLPAYLGKKIQIDANPKHLVYALKAAGRSDALPPLLAVLGSGKLAAEDVAAVLGVISDVGDAAQLQQMAEMIDTPALQSARIGGLDALIRAAETRKAVPAGATSLADVWLKSEEIAVASRAARLVGLWKLEPSRGLLASWLGDAAKPMELRTSAMHGLAALGGVPSRDLFDATLEANPDPAMKVLMIDGLSYVGPQMAARRAVEFLASAQDGKAIATVFSTFLRNKQLPNVLAAELKGKTIAQGAAVEGIRMASSRGLQGALPDALKAAGGVKQMDRPLTGPEMAAMVEKVKTQGDPTRGESVYRRQQMLCMTCHAIGEAGGLIGPNLVSIGASAQVDYLIESLLEPSKKIKEGYHMVIVTTKDGQVVSGGLVQDGQSEVIVRDAANQTHRVPKANIASKQMSPVSMMPPGLTASLREDEFVDLVRFLSELGREGAFKSQPGRVARQWKVMGKMEQDAIDRVRHVGLFALNQVDNAFPWLLAYSNVAGDLPLAELPAAQRMYPWFPKIAQAALTLPEDGKVVLKFNEVKGVVVVVDDHEIKDLKPLLPLELKAGIHRVVVLVTREAGGLGGVPS